MKTQSLAHMIFVGETVLFFLPPSETYKQTRAVPAILADLDPDTNQAELVIFAQHATNTQPIVYTTAPKCDARMPIPGSWSYRLGREDALNKTLAELNRLIEGVQNERASNGSEPEPEPEPGAERGSGGSERDPGHDAASDPSDPSNPGAAGVGTGGRVAAQSGNAVGPTPGGLLHAAGHGPVPITD